MKKIALITAAVAATAFATPAMANEGGEGRIEVRGGLVDGGGVTEEFLGAAVGYDFDLGDTIYVGGEASIDTILASGGGEFFGPVGADFGFEEEIFFEEEFFGEFPVTTFAPFEG